MTAVIDWCRSSHFGRSPPGRLIRVLRRMMLGETTSQQGG
jgi:hypothetical protein